MEDAYKWLFQATLGGEHAISSIEGVTNWMDREWSTLQEPFPNEPLITPLRPDNSLVRVNLRTYKALNKDKVELLQAFIESAKQFSPDKNEFLETWHELQTRLPLLNLEKEEWQALDEKLKPDYPAIDHSPQNLIEAQPAYRVVLKALLK